MGEIKVGDKVKRISKSRTAEYYQKLTSEGEILKIRNKKAEVNWKYGPVKWHNLENLIKI